MATVLTLIFMIRDERQDNTGKAVWFPLQQNKKKRGETPPHKQTLQLLHILFSTSTQILLPL
jgi:hypothetical protein